MTEGAIKAYDWFPITGRGTVVSVDVPGSDHVKSGDVVRFALAPNSPGREGLIREEELYRVVGIEESRCLVYHGPDVGQCVTGRGLTLGHWAPGQAARAGLG